VYVSVHMWYVFGVCVYVCGMVWYMCTWHGMFVVCMLCECVHAMCVMCMCVWCVCIYGMICVVCLVLCVCVVCMHDFCGITLHATLRNL
jgi:hypothetical protein